MNKKKALLIFAKEPIPGQVKSRLIPAIGIKAATQLYEKLLYQTLSVSTRLLNTDVSLYCSTDEADTSLCEDYADRFNLVFRLQLGENLGERMKRALNDALQDCDQAILIGTDCPGYSVKYLESAFEMLNTHDAVIGPAVDGGYVLIGMKKVHALLFNDIPWSTNEVLTLTRERFEFLGWRWAEMETQNDIDEPADLIHVQQLLTRACSH